MHYLGQTAQRHGCWFTYTSNSTVLINSLLQYNQTFILVLPDLRASKVKVNSEIVGSMASTMMNSSILARISESKQVVFGSYQNWPEPSRADPQMVTISPVWMKIPSLSILWMKQWSSKLTSTTFLPCWLISLQRHLSSLSSMSSQWYFTVWSFFGLQHGSQ